MNITFYKYQGTGNDFIIIDNRNYQLSNTSTKRIAQLCDRRFGIGADGLIFLENDSQTHFKMVYFNADGNQSSMCGNGGRCIVAFAKHLGIIKNTTEFMAIDGLHQAEIKNEIVELKMQDVNHIVNYEDAMFLNTGSPHHVQMVTNLNEFDVKTEGAKIRYSERYGKAGSNINFVEPINNETFSVRTYERGVENETLSCGTGVTAVALAMHSLGKTNAQNVALHTLGGNLNVRFSISDFGYNNVWLCGAATQVFKGDIQW